MFVANVLEVGRLDEDVIDAELDDGRLVDVAAAELLEAGREVETAGTA